MIDAGVIRGGHSVVIGSSGSIGVNELAMVVATGTHAEGFSSGEIMVWARGSSERRRFG